MYYEIIYETGEHSIAMYEDDAEALSALQAHHSRAKAGESGKAASTPRQDLIEAGYVDRDHNATRIKKVLVYDHHPADFNVGNEFEVNDLQKQIAAAIKARENDGTVFIGDILTDVANMAGPLVAERTDRHATVYKMKEARELDWDGE